MLSRTPRSVENTALAPIKNWFQTIGPFRAWLFSIAFIAFIIKTSYRLFSESGSIFGFLNFLSTPQLIIVSSIVGFLLPTSGTFERTPKKSTRIETSRIWKRPIFVELVMLFIALISLSLIIFQILTGISYLGLLVIPAIAFHATALTVYIVGTTLRK